MHSRFQCFLTDLYSMVVLIFLFQSRKDRQALLLGRFLNRYRLESSLQRRVLLDVFPVFRDRRGADQLQFTSGK